MLIPAPTAFVHGKVTIEFAPAADAPDQIDGRVKVTALTERRMPSRFGRSIEDLSKVVRPAPARTSDEEYLSLISAPTPLANYMQAAYDLLSESTALAINLLRWRCGLVGPTRPLQAPRFHWSLDHSEWRLAPLPFHRPYASEREFAVGYLSAEVEADVQHLLRRGVIEPLPYELLREAREQLRTNRRSAVVFGVSAAEVAIKRFVGRASPADADLLRQRDAPDVVSLLREFVPQLTEKRTSVGRAVPKRLIRTLQVGAQRRNQIVHQGADAPPFSEIADFLDAVEDVLAMLDWFDGRPWAFGRIRPSVQREWGPTKVTKVAESTSSG